MVEAVLPDPPACTTDQPCELLACRTCGFGPEVVAAAEEITSELELQSFVICTEDKPLEGFNPTGRGTEYDLVDDPEDEAQVLATICRGIADHLERIRLSAWAVPLPEGLAAGVPILREVLDERVRQERLRQEGRFRLTCASAEMEEGEKLGVLLEEVGEVARAFLEKRRLANDVHGKDLRKELLQVAAVCTAWVEALDNAAAVPDAEETEVVP